MSRFWWNFVVLDVLLTASSCFFGKLLMLLSNVSFFYLQTHKTACFLSGPRSWDGAVHHIEKRMRGIKRNTEDKWFMVLYAIKKRRDTDHERWQTGRNKSWEVNIVFWLGQKAGSVKEIWAARRENQCH